MREVITFTVTGTDSVDIRNKAKAILAESFPGAYITNAYITPRVTVEGSEKPRVWSAEITAEAFHK